jgi:hypothetical protein
MKKSNVKTEMIEVLSEGILSNLCLFEESFEINGVKKSYTYAKEVPVSTEKLAETFKELNENIEF